MNSNSLYLKNQMLQISEGRKQENQCPKWLGTFTITLRVLVSLKREPIVYQKTSISTKLVYLLLFIDGELWSQNTLSGLCSRLFDEISSAL